MKSSSSSSSSAFVSTSLRAAPGKRAERGSLLGDSICLCGRVRACWVGGWGSRGVAREVEQVTFFLF